MGRTLIADPDFIGKYLNIVEGRVRPCSSCLTGCLGRIKIGKGLQCEINPEVGRELEPLTAAKIKKHYAVVGGGLAGMEAAITLKNRGHDVDLFEKKSLGGQFNMAPLPSNKESLQKQIDYLIAELENITVIKKEASADKLKGKYDGVIIATGSKPVIPGIPGLKDYRWAEILYDFNMPENKNIVIIGGGLIGVEIANTLTDHNNKVTIIEMLDDIARDMEMVTRKLNLMKLKKNGVPVYTKTKVTKVDGPTLYMIRSNGQDQELVLEGIDLYVVAAGMTPDKSLAEKIGNDIPVYLVGDADKVGDAVSAIQSAYFTCKEL